jgi:hypothetical protein
MLAPETLAQHKGILRANRQDQGESGGKSSASRQRQHHA